MQVELPDGSRQSHSKATRLRLPTGAAVHLYTGGGGGFGPAAERDPAAVADDLADGYVTEAHARAHYPHAFENGPSP
jgi:N-methylhydantoinase B